MKVLITGGAGFIGSHLTDALLQKGHQVTIVDDLSTGRMENFQHVRHYPNFHFVIESIMNETVMDRLISECDVIYHLASAVGVELIVNHPVEVIERCVIGTHIVLKIANRYKRKVLLTSTSEIYGKNSNPPFSEEDDRVLGPTTRSRWSYSSSKAIDEFLALAYHKEMDLPVVIVRLFNTVGPRQSDQYGMVVPRFVTQALKGEPITVYGDGEQSRCFCHVKDVVRALTTLMEHEAAVSEIFNIGSQEEVTIMQLAKRVIERTASKSQVVKIPYEQAYESGFEDMRSRKPNLNKIKKAINWQPTYSLDGILDDIIQEMTATGSNGKSAPARTAKTAKTR
ncbi:MAG TPA: GDP-mannose 4,6-dehydratase [Calditrichia bacterium]|nr:GDP-mannose 4,6-dehydratase [Calditrichota bacterium]HQU73833.1 GDP-mannose 4,6-dehydratase [Calditrichia bacterium]HQV33714.1 GDP-mannose 4,6-dehydratase [Calditrichia bacterium]